MYIFFRLPRTTKEAMPREVEYRDFPGGPKRIEFSDELPHWNMCAPCGMLSAEMYKDERGHFFCRVCVNANSQRKRIFCKHENRDVQLSDLSDATELVLSTHELTVFCPNKKHGCTKYCPLNNMKQHWVECPITPNTKCKACYTMLPMKDLQDHEGVCPETYIQCPICLQGMSRRTYENHQKECQRPPELSKRGPIEKKSLPPVSSNASAPPSLTGPEVASMKNHDPFITESSTDEEKKSCEFCERPVKKCNYEKHLQVCVKREEECSHCSLTVLREEWKNHEDICEKNPVNIKPEPAPSVSKPGKKGKKKLTSDNEAKNSWPPKQLLHSDKDSFENYSFEVIGDDEVEAAAETKTENRASFGGPASKHAGTRAVSQFSPKRSTGNEMLRPSAHRRSYCLCKLLGTQPTLVPTLAGGVVICIQLQKPRHYVGVMAPCFQSVRPSCLKGRSCYHPLSSWLGSPQCVRVGHDGPYWQQCVLAPPLKDILTKNYCETWTDPGKSWLSWHRSAAVTIWPASPSSVPRFLCALLNSAFSRSISTPGQSQSKE
ncbi:unnamed protein product [Ixodes persulcatus]